MLNANLDYANTKPPPIGATMTLHFTAELRAIKSMADNERMRIDRERELERLAIDVMEEDD